jgi:hypothetical protein
VRRRGQRYAARGLPRPWKSPFLVGDQEGALTLDRR